MNEFEKKIIENGWARPVWEAFKDYPPEEEYHRRFF